MTAAEEAQFIALWEQGASYRELAAALRCPLGTVASPSAALAAQGKVQPRQRGGAKARQGDPPAPARAPATAPADSSLPTREAPAITMVAVPELRELIHRFSGLEARVATLEAGTHRDPRDPPAPAPAPAPARVDIEQWTVRLSKAVIERIKAEAATAEKPPSHLLEELVWQALNDRR
jgi:hypothetical protein